MPSPLADTQFDDRTLRIELSLAITEFHSRKFANQMAAELVEYDQEDVLVALVDDCASAVLHHPVTHSLDAIRFDADGIDWDRTKRLKEYLVDPAHWVFQHVDEVDWVHPRYEWVVNNDSLG